MSAGCDDLGERLKRIAVALRVCPPARLATSQPTGAPTRADAGRALARALALAAQGMEDADRPRPPRWRELPMLPDTALGDQVAVLAHDFLRAVAGAPEQVWTPAGRAPIGDVVRSVEKLALATARDL